MRETILYPALVGRIGGLVPAQFLWTIVFALVVWFFLNRHRFGAHVYLTGDNVESARLMGVNVNRTKVLTFAIVGFAAAFAGFVVSEEVLFFWPTLGEGYMLNTLASVFLGGTSVFGGYRHHLRHLRRLLHHRGDQRGHRGRRPDRVSGRA